VARFLTSFLRHPIATGAIAPSSARLAREMVDWIDWHDVSTCVELGPGTGAFTPSILNAMHAETRFFTVELNPEFAAMMRSSYPQVETVCRSVADIGAICDARDVASIDCIVCGLPWAAFPTQLHQTLMSAVTARLSTKGYFCTFAYLQGTILPAGIRFKRLLDKSFASVHRSRTVWGNLPPAFVYQCRAPHVPSM